LKVDLNDVAISSSYDKTLIVWDLHRLRPVSILQGTAPVTTFEWNNSLLVSGERDGKSLFYDLNSGKNFNTLACHTSAVHQVGFSVDGADFNLFTSVGKDGKLTVADLRDNSCIFSQVVHRGAVNVLKSVLNNTIVTASADGTAVVWDVVMGFRPRASLKASAAIFCGDVVGNLFVCGCADGNLIVFDLDTQDALFGFGVDNVGGVNCLGISQNRRKIVTGGDSGTPLLLNF
jgi:WD40 repeat protein